MCSLGLGGRGRAGAEGAGVLILADGYPGKATPIAPEVLEEASRKKLRLYVEYPSALPGLELGQPRAGARGSGSWWRPTLSGPNCPECES